MVEAAAPIVEKHQVIEHTCSRCCGCRHAWFYVAPLVDVIRLALRGNIFQRTIEVVAHVCDILFQEWKLWIRVSDICGNTKGVFIAICQARLLCLTTHGFDVVRTSIIQVQRIETATTIIQERQIISHTLILPEAILFGRTGLVAVRVKVLSRGITSTQRKSCANPLCVRSTLP
jgi:hypothetical protein